ncbi:MAG: GntR family transcriptional regulator [Anaerococcus sp.]|nr:GntR family transcriptional regulator [Anaerococcus sp.]
MQFDSQRPIYLQLLEDFKAKISTGKRESGSKIGSVRDLAKAYGVNPNTIQRALQELERDGLTVSKRTAGRYVTSDKELIESLTNKSFDLIADEFVSSCLSLNLEKDKVFKLLEEYWEKHFDLY